MGAINKIEKGVNGHFRQRRQDPNRADAVAGKK
jgi:hypothetical protein